MRIPDFYLASTESFALEAPRRCWRVKRLSTPQRDDLLLIKIDPPLSPDKYGLQGRDIQLLLVAPRHDGTSLFPVTKWPVYVHVARPLIEDEDLQNRDTILDADFKSLAWAELYQTAEDARLKVM